MSNRTRQKRCCTCKLIKNLDQFHRSVSEKDGLAWRCKECVSKAHRVSYSRTRQCDKVIPFEKRCGTCRCIKSSDRFARNSGKKDGLDSRCKACRGGHCKTYGVTVREKRCNMCQLIKLADDFERHVYCKDGLSGSCKRCRSAARRLVEKRCERCQLIKPIDEFQSSVKRHCKQCTDVGLTVKRRCNLKRQYGLTEQDFNEMLENQDGKCICGDLLVFGSGDSATVDHDHETGEVRGLLCGSCNRTLGHAKDSPERLIRLAAYLGVSQAEIFLMTLNIK